MSFGLNTSMFTFGITSTSDAARNQPYHANLTTCRNHEEKKREIDENAGSMDIQERNVRQL